MGKQAQFINKKSIFDKNLDFPESPGIYKFFDERQIMHILYKINFRI